MSKKTPAAFPPSWSVEEQDACYVVRFRVRQARVRGDRKQTAWVDLSPGPVAALAQSQKSECACGEARGGGGLGKIAELTPPNGWRAGLVCRVLSAEPVLRRPIYQTLFKRGVGAALVAAQRRSLQTPRRILSLRGTRT